MANIDPNLGLTPSIFDRLSDAESAGTDWRRGYSLQQILEAIRRDLEDLLNTRQTNQGIPEHYRHVHASVASFGLPDLSTINFITSQDKDDLCRRLEAVIRHFEPRLSRVRVSFVRGEEGNRSVLRCRIDGRLAVDPAPEVSFDTVMEPTTGQHRVVPGGA